MTFTGYDKYGLRGLLPSFAACIVPLCLIDNMQIINVEREGKMHRSVMQCSHVTWTNILDLWSYCIACILYQVQVLQYVL